MGTYLLKAPDADLTRWKANAAALGIPFAQWLRAAADSYPATELSGEEWTARALALAAPVSAFTEPVDPEEQAAETERAKTEITEEQAKAKRRRECTKAPNHAPGVYCKLCDS